MKKIRRSFYRKVIKGLTAHKFKRVFSHLISEVIKGVTEWFSSFYTSLRGVITELSNLLYLLLYIRGDHRDKPTSIQSTDQRDQATTFDQLCIISVIKELNY